MNTMDTNASDFVLSDTGIKPHILVVDDEPDIRHLVQEILEDEGYQVTVAEDGNSARKAYQQQQPDLILLDIWMPDIDGITLLKEWADEGSLEAPVIMMSGHGSVETAVEATRLGAFDFIEKPLSLAKLLLTVEQALDSEKTLIDPDNSRQNKLVVSEPVGHSPTTQRLREQIKQIAKHDSTVMLSGEAGCGIKVAALYLHNNSLQHDKPFVEVNLASLNYKNSNENIADLKSSQNKFKQQLIKAQNGTLFLRNIDEASEEIQSFLLDFLQSNSFQHIVDASNPNYKTRIICSSHKNLEQLVDKNKFRKDLFYFINVVPLHIPALRDHREDIPDLLNYYSNIMVENENLPYRHFSLAAQNRLRNYDWLGNVRELTNFVQYLLITASESEVTLGEIESAIEQKGQKASIEESFSTTYDLPLREARERFERDYLIHHLIKENGSISGVAKLIGMERTHLYRKLRSLNIDTKKILINKT